LTNIKKPLTIIDSDFFNLILEIIYVLKSLHDIFSVVVGDSREYILYFFFLVM